MKLKSVILFFLFSTVNISQTDLIPIKTIFDNPSYPPQFSEINFENVFDSTSQTTTQGKRKFYIGLNTGYRFNISSHPNLSSNLFFGFSLQLPLSEFVSIQPEINFWKTDYINYPIDGEYFVTDIPILITLNVNYENTGVDLAIGPGILVQAESEKLVSLNIGAGFWIKLIEKLRLTFNFRLQSAGSLSPGGGNSVTSIYLGAGLNYKF